MNSINRRTFLKGSILTAASLSLPVRSWAQVLGANDALRIAVIGFRGQGGSHIKSIRGLAKDQNVRIVALCDVDSDVLGKGVADFGKDGDKVEGYSDIRKLLENKNIDAVSIATPNHWHALAAIWSIQAGKDVYVEKPVSHNVWEGRKLVEAARKHKKIVQTGTQIRSSHGIREAVAWIQAGNLGKIEVARGLCYKRRASIGKVSGPQPVPASIDYDLWCGPAPRTPLMRAKLHYDWHWVWPTGNGDLGNQGIHQMDIARWFLGEKELAPAVFSVGGRLGYEDDGETPNTQLVYQDYRKAPLIFEVRGLPERSGTNEMGAFMKAKVGVVIHCEHGHVLVPDYSSAIVFDKAGKEIKRFQGSTNHHGNFVKAVRSRKVTDLHADILEGHLSSALCHTGNISYRLGKAEKPEVIREKLKGEKDAVETFERMQEHLGANGVDLASSQVTLGEFLKMNPRRERFTNNKAANEMLSRDYRKPFVVPSRV